MFPNFWPVLYITLLIYNIVKIYFTPLHCFYSCLTQGEVLGGDVRAGLVVLHQPGDAHHRIHQLHQQDGCREEEQLMTSVDLRPNHIEYEFSLSVQYDFTIKLMLSWQASVLLLLIIFKPLYRAACHSHEIHQ